MESKKQTKIFDEYSPSILSSMIKDEEEGPSTQWIKIPYSDRKRVQSYSYPVKQTYIGNSYNQANEDLGFNNYRVYTKSLFAEYSKSWQKDLDQQLEFQRDVMVALIQNSVVKPLEQIKSSLQTIEKRIQETETKVDEIKSQVTQKTQFWKKKALDLQQKCDSLERENYRYRVKDAVTQNRNIRLKNPIPFVPEHSGIFVVKDEDTEH